MMETCLAKEFARNTSKVRYDMANDCFWICDDTTGIWKKDYDNIKLMKKINQFVSNFSTEIQYKLIDIKDENIRNILQLTINSISDWLKISQNVDLLIKKIKVEPNLTIMDESYFTNNPDNLLFKNDIILNLRNGIIQCTYLDKITDQQKLNIKFGLYDSKKNRKIRDIFNIIKTETMRKRYIKYLANALFGLNSKRIMLNYGGNGKNILMEILSKILGSCCKSLDNHLLYLDKDHSLDRIHKKRFAIFDGVAEKIDPNIIQNLTNNSQNTDEGFNTQNCEYFHTSIFVNSTKHTIKNLFKNCDATVKNRILTTEFIETEKDVDLIFVQENAIHIIWYLLKNSEMFHYDYLLNFLVE